MPESSHDDRSPLARAVTIASTVTSISLEMVVPPVVGYWIDARLGTAGLFALLGGAIGLTTGIWNLIRFAQNVSRGGRPGQDRANKK